MLPLWRDRVRIALCRDRLVMVHLRGGRGNHIVSKQVIPYSGTESGWQPVLGILQNTLQDKDWKKAEATVILSNHFVRFLVLPWNDVTLTDAEQLAVAQHRFDEVYGADSANWEVRLSEGPVGTPSMASAVPQGLLNELKAIFKASTLRLKSVQPYLMSAFNASRRELGSEQGWFVLAERDSFCIGLVQGGQWSSIRLRHVVADWFEEALLVLEREALLTAEGKKFNKVFVHAPELFGFEPIKRGPWLLHPLKLNLIPGISQAEIANYAIAAAWL